jgi:hypothetical protein
MTRIDWRWLLPMCAALPMASARADIPKLQANDAVYELHMGPLTLGQARFALMPSEKENCYRYEYTATPQGMATMFVGMIREVTEFCASDKGLQSQHYEFHRADRADKDFALDFDWTANVIRGGDPAEQKMSPGTLDRLAIQQAVRMWVIEHVKDEKPPEEVEFTMGDRTRVVTYKFALGRREKINVPAGKFDTIIVQRVDDPKKTLRFWLAPERDYTPVKVVQDQDGQPELRMLLR